MKKKIHLFYDKVLKYFKPTSANNFPLISNLEEIKNIAEAPEIPNYEGIDFNKAQDVFAERHGVTYEPPPGTEKISLEEIIKDDKIMTAANLLKKYGINRCGQAWIEASNRMTTEQHIEDDLKFKKGRSNPDYFHN